MFNVYVYNGNEIPKDDICYINAKEGILIKKRVGVMESITPVKNISFLPSLQPMVKMHIPKLSGSIIAKVANFFKEVYKLYQSESVVLIFYNQETKKYKIIPPKQEVSGASVSYNKGMMIKDMLMIGTIHSHSNFSAFHSTVDDNDEKFFDGLHITIGHVNEEYPSISCSVVANGFRHQTNAEEYISNIIVNPEIKNEIIPQYKSYKFIDGKMTEIVNTSTTTTTRLDRRFVLNVPEQKRQFNPEWMKMVEKKVYTYTNKYNNGWGNGYNQSYWGDWYEFMKGSKIPQRTIPSTHPLNVGPVKSGIEFPKHDNTFLMDEKFDKTKHPCLTCRFRDYHVEELLEMMEDEEEEEGAFQCSKCKAIVEDSEEDIICPNCKTDEYLEVIEVFKESSINESNSQFDTPNSTSPTTPIQNNTPHFHTCCVCGNLFYKVESDEICPFCYTEMECKTEEMLIDQANADSGGEYIEEVQKMALVQAAKEEDIAMKSIPIPIPNEPNTPMSITEKIRIMFKNKFGGIS